MLPNSHFHISHVISALCPVLAACDWFEYGFPYCRPSHVYMYACTVTDRYENQTTGLKFIESSY